MKDYQKEFIRFAIDNEVIEFGEFKLKSGRISPWFFNAGRYNSGRTLAKLGQYYAQTLMESPLVFDTLFGPAYKGIPLVSATAVALATEFDRNMPYVFNRKEVKDHGEGGLLIGAELTGRVVIVDDVITAGTAIREVMTIIDQSPATIAGVLISVDRQERGLGTESAIQEIERAHGIQVVSVVCFAEILEYLEANPHPQADIRQMLQYREQYGVKDST